MKSITNWIKRNKLAAVLIVLIIGYLFYQNFFPPTFQLKEGIKERELVGVNQPLTQLEGSGRLLPPLPQPDYTPTTEVEDRLVIKESSLSLLVRDVTQEQEKIKEKTRALGGYMVESRIYQPEEAPTGSITVRVPQENLDQALAYFRQLAAKVVSENISGQDVTDEYVDIEARLDTLLKTKTKFEEILSQAARVEDILKVQRELVNLQRQIDSLKGQQNYLEKSAQLSKITVYLSTDELALPYAPAKAWRPRVIFKQAVRSLVRAIRQLGTLVIWLLVYAVVWLPLLIIFLIWRRRQKKISS